MNFLTDRQIEVLRMISRGRSTKQIAAGLGICRGTVDKHKEHLYAALGVRGIVPLAMKAVEYGVVSAPQTKALVPSRVKQRVRWGIPQ